MSITVLQLAKQLEIAPEAVMIHAMEFDLDDLEEDSIIPDEIAQEIRKLEQTDEVKQTEYEIEEELDREIIEKQQKQTAGQKKTTRKKKEKAPEPKQEDVKIIKKEDDGTIILPESMTVREFSLAISKPIPIVLVKLKQNGIIANLKQEIDYETAAIIAQELGAKVKKEAVQLSGEDLFRADLSRLLEDEEAEHLKSRPPVVSIMGHVDHGKTSILDYIRESKVVDTEAGGITQSIGAYQVQLPDKNLITFLDTPGHEAFTLMRARGAKATDLAILVVAATEGLKPQSLEAINHAKEAGIPIIVAINKMDLDGANPDTVKTQLSEHDLTPEDWGGSVPCIPVSAKTGKGIDELLETVKITAEIQELKANPDRPCDWNDHRMFRKSRNWRYGYSVN
jgi:translation initiation factor IF-2